MKINYLKFIGILFLFGIILSPFQAFSQKKDNPLDGFDDFVNQTLKDWNVPGVGIAIVKDGKILLTKGYGFADVENKRKVDKNTLFAIGSSSKAFTALSVMQLVDDKKIDLDEPIRTYLSDFKLHDEYTTNHITTRDLLCHRSGLPRHDFAWYGSDATRTELYNRLQYLEPSAPFRQNWQYQNLMYMTAGYLVGQTNDETWEEAVQRRILEPLDMKSTNFSVDESIKNPNHALPYKEKNKKIKLTDFRNLDAVGPAGSINSNAVDMAKWLQLLLNEGNFDGKEIVSAASLKEVYQPQMIIPGGISDSDIYFPTYGLAWMLNSYRGHFRVEHGGNIDGFTANVCFMPRDGFGVVILTNMNGTTLPSVLRNNVIDRLLGLEIRDWNSELLEKVRGDKPEVEEEEDLVQIQATKPSFELKEYVGKYTDLGYGTMEITLNDKKTLNVKINGIEDELKHYHFDIFTGNSFLSAMKFQFVMNTNGELSAVQAKLEPAIENPIVFKKEQAVIELSENKLKIYEGKYEFKAVGQIATVAIKEGDLTIELPGQPTFTLIGTKENQFNIKDLEGFSVKFLVEKKKSIKVIFMQPNGNFTFERVEE